MDRKIISGSSDKSVKVWSLHTGQCLNTFGGYFKGHTDRVWSVAISSDETKIFSGSQDKSIKVWDIQTGDCITTLQGHTVYSIAISPLTLSEKQIIHLQQNDIQNAKAIDAATERLSTIENNMNRLNVEARLNALEGKMNSLQEERDKANARILQLETTLNKVLHEKATKQAQKQQAQE